jgi:hypothetical protein
MQVADQKDDHPRDEQGNQTAYGDACDASYHAE